MKKCPFCAEEVQDEAIVCKHCGKTLDVKKVKGKEKKKSNFGSWKSWAFIVGSVLVVAFFINQGIEKNTEEVLDGKYKDTGQSQEDVIDFAKVEKGVNDLIDTGLIKKINPELNQAYVDRYYWDAHSVVDKETAAKTMAYYVGNKKGTGLYWVDIYDWQSGKKLASYSASWGFKINE